MTDVTHFYIYKEHKASEAQKLRIC